MKTESAISLTSESEGVTGQADSAGSRQAAVDWLLGRINYERVEIPYGERQLKLDRMRELLVRLGRPDAGMRIVHVAGTKGKGSTAAMIAGMLSAAGFRTGLFTSPHVVGIEERFAVDGGACSGAELVRLVERVRPVVAEMDRPVGGLEENEVRGQRSEVRGGPERDARGSFAGREDAGGDGPTFFEIVTAIALLHFAERGVDAAVLEVGLGGRLDSTNVCLPAVSVITSISFDHMKQLGNTLGAIAREKAGIIKPGVPVVSGVLDAEPQAVIAEVAREHGCRLIQLGREFDFDYVKGDFGFRIADCGLKDERGGAKEGVRCQVSGVSEDESAISHISLGMAGRHQAGNAAVAVAVVGELRRQGWCISEGAVREGLSGARLPARVERFELRVAENKSVTVIIDAAHNPASARALVETLEELPRPARRTLILSISSDKDARAIVDAIVSHFDRVLVTQYQENPRVIEAEELAGMVRERPGVRGQGAGKNEEGELGSRGAGEEEEGDALSRERRSGEVTVYATPGEAWGCALASAEAGELVCITGSFFLAAEMRPAVERCQGARS